MVKYGGNGRHMLRYNTRGDKVRRRHVGAVSSEYCDEKCRYCHNFSDCLLLMRGEIVELGELGHWGKTKMPNLRPQRGFERWLFRLSVLRFTTDLPCSIY